MISNGLVLQERMMESERWQSGIVDEDQDHLEQLILWLLSRRSWILMEGDGNSCVWNGFDGDGVDEVIWQTAKQDWYQVDEMERARLGKSFIEVSFCSSPLPLLLLLLLPII